MTPAARRAHRAAPGNGGRRRAALFVALAAILPAPALLALHFRDGPPARVTGGFGEDSCVACHFGSEVNDPAGRLTLTGFPERYLPGGTYDLELTLTREPPFAVGGFQLAIRAGTDGAQAGTIRLPAAEESHTSLLSERGVQFAQHRLARSVPGDAGVARWRLSWIAPVAAARVVLHAAAVAGNGDESQAGDHVHTLEAVSAPAAGRPHGR